MAQFTIGKLDPLQGSKNYTSWKVFLSAILRGKKLMPIITEERPLAFDSEAKESEWNDKNDEAFCILITSLAPNIAGLFVADTDAKSVWDKLQKMFVPHNKEDQAIDLGISLKNLTMTNDESVEEYIGRGKEIIAKAAALDHIISERELVYHVVRGVNEKLQTTASILRTQRSASIEDVQSIFQEEESRKSTRIRYVKNEICKTGIRGPITCYNCNRKGHISRDCWFKEDEREKEERKNKEKGNNVICHNTYNNSHNITNYWLLDSGCNSHMSVSSDYLIDLQPYVSKIDIAENDRTIQSEGIGKVTIKTEGSYPYPLKMRETVIPEFDSTPLAVSVQPGETAMLPCRVRNLGDKDVSWLRGKDFMVISHGRAVFTRDPRFRVVSPDNDPSSWNLQLRNARLTDEGLYECQVNTDPKIQQRILLTVSDGREDTVILGSKIRYVRLGNSLSLTCQVRLQTGLPRQRPLRLVDWHLNNKSLFDVEGRSVAVDTEKNGNEVSSTLTVGRLTQDHSGIYTCRPLVANTTASVMVHVLDGERTAAMQGPGPLASEVIVSTAPPQLSRPALYLTLALFTSELWFLVI